MIAITTMMVVATIQSSINKMVPKTAYYKMIDYWLLYSFNIIIIIMIVHTYTDKFIPRNKKTGMWATILTLYTCLLLSIQSYQPEAEKEEEGWW